MGNKIFVGNLSFEATEQDLMDLFSADGRQVERVSIVTDRESGRPRGFAFVEMANSADTSAAIEALNGQDLHGRALRVDEAHDKPRGGGGGGGGGGRGGRGGGGGYGGGGGGRRY
ncbi:MAG: RNA recognition motif domain-containing protein [Planctomycetota bacterium]|jgi:RNA recognition motif-containing protein